MNRMKIHSATKLLITGFLLNIAVCKGNYNAIDPLDDGKHKTLFNDPADGHYENGTYITEIPMADAFITENAANAYINIDSGLHEWTSSKTVISLFFYALEKTSFNVSIRCQVLAGERSTLRLQFQNATENVTVSGKNLSDFKVGQFSVKSAGYYHIDLMGFAKDAAYFADVTHLIFKNQDGPAVTRIHGLRYNPLSYLWYQYPDAEIEYSYLELRVPNGVLPNMSCYSPITSPVVQVKFHQIFEGERNIAFTVWPQGDNRVKLLSRGNDVTEARFAVNGTGGIAQINYNWKTDTTYRVLVRGRPMVQNATFTTYTLWWAEEKGDWNLLASFLRPSNKRELIWGVGSYLDNFSGWIPYMPRTQYIGNHWAITTSGVWQEVTNAKFTLSGDKALDEPRVEFDARLRDIDGSEFFEMKWGGFEKGQATVGQTISRRPTGKKPYIVFSDLP